MSFKPLFSIYIIIALAAVCLAFMIFCAIKPEYHQARLFRRTTMVILMLCILARPVFYITTNVGTASTNLDIFFVVDMSGSMVAKDCDNSTKRRYEKAAEDIVYIAKKFNGASYSIVAQDFNTYTAAPLTENLDILEESARSLMPKNSRYTQDSDLSTLLDYTATHIRTNQQHRADHKNLVFVFSDGEDRVNGTTTVPQLLVSNTATGAVFGYGSADGSEIEEIKDGVITKNPVKDDNNDIVISTINTENLENIAHGMGVKYQNRTEEASEKINLEQVDQEILEIKNSKATAFEDFYWVPALILMGLLLWEFSYDLNKLLQERKAI